MYTRICSEDFFSIKIFSCLSCFMLLYPAIPAYESKYLSYIYIGFINIWIFIQIFILPGSRTARHLRPHPPISHNTNRMHESMLGNQADAHTIKRAHHTKPAGSEQRQPEKSILRSCDCFRNTTINSASGTTPRNYAQYARTKQTTQSRTNSRSRRILITHCLDTMLRKEDRSDMSSDDLIDLISLARKPSKIRGRRK
jgi:hypothetical protein